MPTRIQILICLDTDCEGMCTHVAMYLFFYSCRPVDQPYWFALIAPWGIIHLLAYIVLLFSPFVYRHKNKIMGSHSTWLREHIGLLLAFVFFDIAWGVGLPSTHSLDLGAIRVIFQVIFVVSSILLGLVIFVVFCMLSREVRGVWVDAFNSIVPGRSKSLPITDRGLENVYELHSKAAEAGLPSKGAEPFYEELKDPMEERMVGGSEVMFSNILAAEAEATEDGESRGGSPPDLKTKEAEAEEVQDEDTQL